MNSNNFTWNLLDKSQAYDELTSWWKEHDAFHSKIIDYDTMPNRIFVVYKDLIPVYAIPVYISDSDFCYIGWVTSNPKAPLKSKFGALEYLYEIISVVMKSQGFNHILSKTNLSGLKKALENSGFKDAEMTQFYIKKL